MSLPIAQKLRFHAEGEFVKECIQCMHAELLASEKIKLSPTVSLSRRTISDQIIVLSQDIEKRQHDSAKKFQFFSFACNEFMGITNTAH